MCRRGQASCSLRWYFDVYRRRVLGWAMANHMRKELVLDALNMAIYRRKPRGVVHHSDQGSQYTSIAFGQRCKEAGVLSSVDRSEIATITRCARALMRRSSASCLLSIGSRLSAKRRWPFSTLSRAGTTRIGGTQPSATFHLTTSSGGAAPRLDVQT
jgi:transposase InsO family protein